MKRDEATSHTPYEPYFYFTVWVDVLISTVGVKYNWTKFSRILQKNLIILILAQVFGKKSILRPIIKLWKGIIFKQKK